MFLLCRVLFGPYPTRRYGQWALVCGIKKSLPDLIDLEKVVFAVFAVGPVSLRIPNSMHDNCRVSIVDTEEMPIIQTSLTVVCAAQL
jgi:hypothetical protein